MAEGDRFLGYRRPDGTVGVRNDVLVLSATGLTGPTARRIGAAIAGAKTVSMPYDAGVLGEDEAAQHRALVGLGRNPNVGAALIIGGNPPKVERIAEAIAATGKPVEALSLDGCGHDALVLTDKGVRAGAKLAREVSSQRREPAPVSCLFLGLECGRSDPSSGLTANPLLGLIADRMVDAGGSAVIGEATEWLGAEHLLARRAASPAVAQAILEAVRGREKLALDAGVDLLGHNPGPTNIAAGLSTIEEKSLGNIAKSGSRPIQSVLAYAQAPDTPGLHLMDAPAYAPESLTGFTAAGAQVMVFTTGVGNSFSSLLAPTLKVSANPETCARLDCQLDFEAAEVFLGREPIEAAADRLFQTLLEVASGTATWGEILGEGEEVVSRFGAAL
jgi:altronate dehydratase large subunit